MQTVIYRLPKPFADKIISRYFVDKRVVLDDRDQFLSLLLQRLQLQNKDGRAQCNPFHLKMKLCRFYTELECVHPSREYSVEGGLLWQFRSILDLNLVFAWSAWHLGFVPFACIKISLIFTT